jgi:hypothetical protein
MIHYSLKFTIDETSSSKNGQTTHVYCFFSVEGNPANLITFPIKEKVNVCKIENKLLDEGVYKITRAKNADQLIKEWFDSINAISVSYVNTIKLVPLSVKQFEIIKGKFQIEEIKWNPYFKDRTLVPK